MHGSTQLDLFSATPPPREAGGEEGERRKRLGMQRAYESKESQVGLCREVAFDIQRGRIKHADGEKRADGLCTADDVAAWWERRNDYYESIGQARVPWIGNACGQLFQDGNWVSEGYIKSARPEAHRNPILQWRWKYKE